jgi:hypothetical protein
VSWTRLDDGIYDHPKVLEVDPLDRLLYVWALCWSARHRTDGRLRRRALGHVAALAGVTDLDAAAARLVAAGLWETDDDGWLVHDFTDYQPAAADVDELRQKRAEAGRQGGLRSGQTRRGGSSEANREASASSKPEANGKQVPKQNRTPSRPVPSPVASASSSSGRDTELSTGQDDDEVEQRARAAAAELGRRDSDRAAPMRRAPVLHRQRCTETRWTVQGAELTALARQHPDLDAVQLADRVEHPAIAPVGPSPGPRLVLCGDCGLEHRPAAVCPVLAVEGRP